MPVLYITTHITDKQTITELIPVLTEMICQQYGKPAKYVQVIFQDAMIAMEGDASTPAAYASLMIIGELAPLDNSTYANFIIITDLT